MSGQASVQMRVDVGLRPGNINPHTFISVTHPDGKQTEYGLIPATPENSSGPPKDLQVDEVVNMGREGMK